MVLTEFPKESLPPSDIELWLPPSTSPTESLKSAKKKKGGYRHLACESDDEDKINTSHTGEKTIECSGFIGCSARLVVSVIVVLLANVIKRFFAWFAMLLPTWMCLTCKNRICS